mmetsp:Transcript_10908/g.26034  ORF Transcript_10908/g.26034 Transcript_10908/m.26034 type:complete len:135 (-) Transcript_10908:45-449(-)
MMIMMVQPMLTLSFLNKKKKNKPRESRELNMVIRSLEHRRLAFVEVFVIFFVSFAVVDAWVVPWSSSVAPRSIPSALALTSPWTSSSNNRRRNRKAFSNTVLWDAYEDQYAAYLNSSKQQPQQQQQQQPSWRRR